MTYRGTVFTETAGQAVNGVREYYMVDCIGSEILTEEGENHEVGGVAPEVDDDGFGILQYIHDASALLIGELCGVDVSYPVVDEHTALFGNGIFGKIDEFSCVAVCTGRYPYSICGVAAPVFDDVLISVGRSKGIDCCSKTYGCFVGAAHVFPDIAADAVDAFAVY